MLSFVQKEKMPRGTNSSGNQYTSDGRGNYYYHNSNGSEYYQDGNHAHYTNSSGNGGWHRNDNTGNYSSGAQFRSTNTRSRY